MARDFVVGTPDYYTITAPVTAVPFTFACWFNVDSATINHTLFSLSDTSGDVNNWRLIAAGTTTGDPLEFACQGGGAAAVATTPTGYTVGTWHHGLCIAASATDRKVAIDNGTIGTNVTSRGPVGIDTLAIGAGVRLSIFSPVDGRIVWPCLWNVALTGAEIAALASGYHPRLVRPGAIAFFAPLDTLREIDEITNVALTITGAPAVADNPGVLRYRKRAFYIPVAGGPPAPLEITPAAAIAEAVATAPTIVQGSVSVTAAAAVAEAVAVAPTVREGSISVTPAVAAAAAVAGAPTVILGSLSLTPSVAIVEAVAVAPTVQEGALSITPPAAVAVAVAVAPLIVQGSLSVTPGAAVAEAVAADPEVDAGGDVDVHPAAASAEAVASIGAVVLSSIGVQPAAASALAVAAIGAAVQGSLSLTAGAAVATATAVSPVVVLEAVTITPPAAIANAVANSPTVEAGADVDVMPPAAIASAVASIGAVLESGLSLTPVAAIATAGATAPVVVFGSVVYGPAAAIAEAMAISPSVFAGTIINLGAIKAGVVPALSLEAEILESVAIGGADIEPMITVRPRIVPG